MRQMMSERMAILDEYIEKADRESRSFEQKLAPMWNKYVWRKRMEAAQGLIPASEVPEPIVPSASLADGETCKIVSMNVSRTSKSARV